MKKRTAVTLLCLAIAFATAAMADDQEFQGWMKETQKTVGKLRKEIEAKSFTDVATDAATLRPKGRKILYLQTPRLFEIVVVGDDVRTLLCPHRQGELDEGK